MSRMMGRTFAAMVAVGLASASLQATTVTHVATPDQVPDEQTPRVVNTAPTGFGSEAWQGPASGKSNWHARYLLDGDVLSILFPDDAATLTIGDIASISYFTYRPDGTPAGRDWWIQIYTRTTGVDDESSWYGHKYTNNYSTHTETDSWTEYSTDNGMTFAGLDFDAFKQTHANELIEMISIQTDSGWNGFDGYVDGLVITLTNGNVGIVDFQGSVVPLPAAAWAGLTLLGGVGGARVWRRRKQA